MPAADPPRSRLDAGAGLTNVKRCVNADAGITGIGRVGTLGFVTVTGAGVPTAFLAVDGSTVVDSPLLKKPKGISGSPLMSPSTAGSSAAVSAVEVTWTEAADRFLTVMVEPLAVSSSSCSWCSGRTMVELGRERTTFVEYVVRLDGAAVEDA